MKRNKFSWMAIIITVLCLIGVVMIEINLFLEYQAVSGKTRGLFSLNELGYLESKILLVLGGLIGLILTLVAFIRKESKSKTLLALVFSILVISLPFIRIWNWFV